MKKGITIIVCLLVGFLIGSHVDGVPKSIALSTYRIITDKESVGMLGTKEVVRPLSLNRKQTAFLLMDVWDIQKMVKNAQYYNNRFDKVTREKIVPLLDVVRKNRVFVIHAAHGEKEHPLVKQLPGEMNADNMDTETLTRILKARGIDTIIYSGFATNKCILFRPSGMLNMQPRGFRVILVKDATAAEEPEGAEWKKNVVIDMVESNVGPTTTAEYLRKALEEG